MDGEIEDMDCDRAIKARGDHKSTWKRVNRMRLIVKQVMHIE